MNLSEIKNELQQVLQLVEDWQVNGIDDLERDIVLGKMRKVYSAMRFDAAPQPETIDTDEQMAAMKAATPETIHQAENETPFLEPAEELPVGIAISLDDVFESFVPEDLVPVNDSFEVKEAPIEEAIHEERAADEVLPVEEEPVEESAHEAESKVNEECVATEQEQPTEDQTAAAEPEAEVEVSEPSAVVESIPEQVDAKPADEPQCEKPTAVEQSTASIAEPSLFGDDELFVTRKSRRSRMMSLYDEEESTFSIIAESKNEVEAPIAAEQPQEPMAEPAAVVESAPDAEPEEFVETMPASDEFVEVDVPASSVTYSHHNDLEPQMTDTEVAPLADDDEKIEPYIEPQIEVAVATPAVSAVPESEQVIGEVIKNDVRTIADIIAPKNTTVDQIAKSPITDLNRAIGINDRFLLIRDLFGGSSEIYEKVIWRLNNFDNLEDCLIYIAENFDWNPNSEGAKLIMDLIERKYN